MKYIWIFLVVLILAGAGCSKTEQTQNNDSSPIKIGWVGPLSGDASSLGQDALAASKLAAEEVNAGGGINGRMLELVSEDGKCQSKDAVSAFDKILATGKPSVVVGGLCSSETAAIAPIAEQNKIVLFTGCSSAPSITYAGDYIFRSYPSDALQGKFVAEYVYNDLGKRKVAILAVTNEWGEGIRNVFANRLKELGGTVVFNEQYDQNTRDLRAELTKIKQTDTEVLYFLGVTEASLIGLKQARELGLSMQIIGGDTWDDSKITASADAEGILYTVPSNDTPQDWKDKLKARGGDSTACTPGTYNNVHILADIMKRVGTNSTKIKDELYKINNYRGVNGPITIDKNGDIVSSKFVVKKISGGKAEVVR